MTIDLIQDIRARLEREDTRSEALEHLVSQCADWVKRAHKNRDWEFLSELFSLELVAIRCTLSGENGRSAEDALKNFQPFVEDCPMMFRVAAELELMDDSDVVEYDDIRQRAEMAWTMGGSLEDGGNVREGLAEFLIGRAWLNSLPPGEEDSWMLGSLENCIGDAWRAGDEPERSLAAYQRGLSVDLEDDPDTRGCLENNLGLTLRQLGRAQEAVDAFHRALDLWASNPELCTERLAWISAAEGNLGTAYTQLGDLHRALARQRRTVHLNETLYEQEPTLANLDGLAKSLGDLAGALRQLGHLEEGTEVNRRARDLVAENQTGELDLRLRLASLEMGLANGLSMCQRYEEATHCYRASILIWRELQAEGRPEATVTLGLTQSNMGMAFAGMGEHDQAIRVLRMAIDTLSPSENDPNNSQHLARAYSNLAYLLETRGQAVQAASAYRKSCGLWRDCMDSFPAGMLNLASAEKNLAGIYMDSKRFDKATPLLTDALELYDFLMKERGQLDLGPERAGTALLLGEAFLHLGKYAAAGAHLADASERWALMEGHEEEEEVSRKLLEQAREEAARSMPPPF